MAKTSEAWGDGKARSHRCTRTGHSLVLDELAFFFTCEIGRQCEIPAVIIQLNRSAHTSWREAVNPCQQRSSFSSAPVRDRVSIEVGTETGRWCAPVGAS